MFDTLVNAISDASGIDKETVQKVLVRSKDPSKGDFSLPCFTFAKQMGVPPPTCVANIRQKLAIPSGISKVEAVGPYLNFYLDRGAEAARVVREIISAQSLLGKKPTGGKPIILEYASLNIAKLPHLGHLRNLSIGLALDRLFRWRGVQLTTIDHLGDWGTQFGFVWVGCKLWGMPTEMSVESLLERYIRATTLRDQQEEKKVPAEDASKPDANEMAKEYFRALEDGDKEAFSFWDEIVKLSLVDIHKLYARLGIKMDHTMGESFYRDKLETIENKVRASGVLENSRGALGVDLGKELGFARLFTEDGRSLYSVRDLATADYRHERFNAEKIYYIVDSAQTLHFRQLVGVLKKMHHPAGETVTHVAYGRVPGMSTRKGTMISIRDFLDEAKERALDAYRTQVTKRPDGLDEDAVAEAIAIGATLFYFNTHSRTKDLKFSWEEALTFQGDSGPYVQYAHARLCSIAAKAKEAGISVTERMDPAALSEGIGYDLAALLARFDHVLDEACEQLEPSHIAHYLLDVARTFSRAYNELRVVGEPAPVAEARLALFLATQYVVRVGLTLLGVPAVERM